MITNEQITEWRRLAEAATPGPWEEVAESGEWWMTTATDEDGSLYVIPDTANMNQADVDFIVASRSAVPALLAEVERLQWELDECRSVYGYKHSGSDFRPQDAAATP